MKTATLQDLLTESELAQLKDIEPSKEIQNLTVRELTELFKIIPITKKVTPILPVASLVLDALIDRCINIEISLKIFY